MNSRSRSLAFVAVALVVAALAGSDAGAIDRPFGTSRLYSPVYDPSSGSAGSGGQTSPGAPFSKTQIERFRCASAGNPSASVDISCNTTEYGQDYAPDNEIAIVVDPTDPEPPRRRLERLLLPLQQLDRRPPGHRRHRVLHLLRRRRDLDRRPGPGAIGSQCRRPLSRLRPTPRRRAHGPARERRRPRRGQRRPGRRRRQPLDRRRRRPGASRSRCSRRPAPASAPPTTPPSTTRSG